MTSMFFSRILFAPLLAFLLALACLSPPAAHALTESDFLSPEQAFTPDLVMTGLDELEARFRIAPGYYLYRERFGLAVEPPDAARLGPAAFPRGKVKHDPTFDKEMEVYYGAAAIKVPLEAQAGAPFTVVLSYQGCADAGLCYPPEQRRITVRPAAGVYATAFLSADGNWTPAGKAWAAVSSGSSTFSLASLLDAGDMGLADALGGLGALNTVLVFFVLGVLLALTPCVLPMIPILSALIAGDRHVTLSRWRGLGLAAAYVAGMSVVYTILGVAAGLAGVGLAGWLQSPWVLVAFAIVLLILALASFGAFTLQLPLALQSRLSAGAARIPGGKATGTALMGAMSSLILGPCVAAPLAGALLYISRTGDVWLGAVALFALAWGMGVPLLLVGASSRALLPRAQAWMGSVNQAFGVLLLATAWWMVLPLISAPVQMVGWALLLLLAGVLLRAFDALPAAPAGALRVAGKAIGLLFALCAALLVVGAASGGRDTLRPLDHWFAANRTDKGSAAAPQAGLSVTSGASPAYVFVKSIDDLDARLAQADRPALLYFYADWCVSCKEMERFTFSDPQVAARLSRMVLLKADVTANTPDDRALLKRYSLFGPPSILFFDTRGRPMADGRIVGFESAQRFGARLDAVLAGRGR